MKTSKLMLLAGLMALGSTLQTATAGEPILSPRWAALRHDLRTVPAAESPNLVSGHYLGAALKAEGLRSVAVETKGSEPNLVISQYPGAAAKVPLQRPMQFRIAPLK